MANNKQQKKKERERRVAQKKLADIEKRAQTAKTTQTSVPKTNKLSSGVAVPKAPAVTTNARQTFARRRSVG
ncbi:MAG: hypothetical protein EXS05_03175 [Planctomycetaceae bacterium]|nr:hypothetical protein [Planctomycetaceae bacterium]